MLYIVPTPIGNLGDITQRAVEVLKNVDLILAEDTRSSSVLLQHIGVQNRSSSFHMHNEHQKLDKVISDLKSGLDIALISDSGTPGISDPGFLLVRACIQNSIELDCLPGPVAFVPALILSGLPCDRFCFEGFLPHKKGRNKRVTSLIAEERTMIFYESPHRLLKTLDLFALHFGVDRQVSVSREITKMHQETKRGSLEEVINFFKENTIKGEFVVVLAGCNH